MDYINTHHPIRKSDCEKQAFREYVLESVSEKGIQSRVEETNDGRNKNIVIGDPATAKAVLTAHYDTPWASLFPNIMMPKNAFAFYSYQFVPVIFLLTVSLTLSYLVGFVSSNDDEVRYISFLLIYYGLFFLTMRGFKNSKNHNDNTSGVATVLSIIDSLPKNELDKVAFILFDNEEKGKKGSAAFFKDRKEFMGDKFLINFDCVGNGNNIIFIAQPKAIDCEELKALKDSFAFSEEFNVDFCTYKQGNSNSDHKNFPKGVGCVACKRAKSGLLYTPYIHTPKDTVANDGNIDFLAKNMSVFVKKLN